MPINHILTITSDLAQRRPEVPAQVMALFRAAKAASGLATDPDIFPIGLTAMRPSIHALLRSAYDQKLLPRPLDCDALFAPLRALIGDLVD